jgi:hypothetical protein
MSGLGEAFAKVTSEKAHKPIGAEFNAELNGGDYELRHSEASEKTQKPIEKAHTAIGAEFNAELNGGDYELRHSEASSKPITDPVFENRFNPVGVSQEICITPKPHAERSASLQAQTAALFNDVSTDVQSDIEIEDL